MSKSDEIASRAAKYNRVERVADTLGRVIGVRRLKPSQQLKVEEYSSDLTGSQSFTDDETGKTIEVPRRTILFYAAAVCEIDETPIPFPRNRGELDAILDALDDEGLAAVSAALVKLAAATKAADPDDSDKTPGERAKNSPRASNIAT